MTIVLLCPTRARPQQFARMVESVRNTTTTPVLIYAYLASDEPYMRQYNDLGLATEDNVIWEIGPDYPTAYKWNKLAEQAMADGEATLFMLAADDTVFATPGWDKALLDHYNALENKAHVYHLCDSRNPSGTPHPIVTHDYIKAMGYFLPPLFMHWFVDTWTVDIARSNGCFTHLKDYLLVHDKPSDRGQADETHNRIRQMGWHERDTWTHHKCQHLLDSERKRLGGHVLNSMTLGQRYKHGNHLTGVFE